MTPNKSVDKLYDVNICHITKHEILICLNFQLLNIIVFRILSVEIISCVLSVPPKTFIFKDASAANPIFLAL